MKYVILLILFLKRTQIENFLNKEEALHIHSPKVCSTSIGRDSQKTMEKIRKYPEL